ncbi:hypothetical protein KP509_38G051100 [Ceratopteris richardii]|uniref:DUF7725 domain-containing protein n=1 Tax=Ceratopteris richardii TaxID=49495 RepID=A0A8T2Q4S1_CERRI|nr:hypothetical protein KP509_38G051100 [Ceratopteris richardii]
MQSGGVHKGFLEIQNQVRKEWTAVAEASARERLVEDGSMEHDMVNGSARVRPHHSGSLKNVRIFFSGVSNGNSSDSDHHAGDMKRTTVATHEAIHQNDEDVNLYDEALHVPEQKAVSNGKSRSPNGLPVDFGSSNTSKYETLEQHLHDVIRQREQLQRLEAELRAQFIARSEIVRVQNNFDEQSKQHASVVSNLQEQLQERDLRLLELEQKLEEQEQQLHVNQKEASEAVWAKDGLLREQSNELSTLRLERETLLAEQKTTLSQFEEDRAELVSRLQDLEEQLHEKDRQLHESNERHQSAQETLASKEEQLREAQAWVQRAQGLDAFYANAHNLLHAELRDRHEQISQLWLGQQRQLAEVERYHAQTIQRLRMEVAEVREQNRMLKSGCSSNLDKKSEQPLHFSHEHSEQLNPSEGSLKLREQVLSDNNQAEHPNILVVPTPIVLGTSGPVLNGNPIPVLHQLSGQPEGVLPTIPAVHTDITQSSFPNPIVIPRYQQLSLLHNQQNAIHHFQQVERQSLDLVPVDNGNMKNNERFPHVVSVPAIEHGANMLMVTQRATYQESCITVDKQVGQTKEEDLNCKAENMTGFEKTSTLRSAEDEHIQQHQVETGGLCEKTNSDTNSAETESMKIYAQHPHLPEEDFSSSSAQTTEQHIVPDSTVAEEHLTGYQVSKIDPGSIQESQKKWGQGRQEASKESTSSVLQRSLPPDDKSATHMLLDEKSLLTCLVRVIPSEASARIKISTTLPNRLGKILAPLHWHDYKKQYGRLDDFIRSHPKLFVTDGDFVHLRKGAHAIISATATVAKVAAAAATHLLCTTWPPTVALTPVAQSQSQRMWKKSAPVFMDKALGYSDYHVKQDILFTHAEMATNQ